MPLRSSTKRDPKKAIIIWCAPLVNYQCLLFHADHQPKHQESQNASDFALIFVTKHIIFASLNHSSNLTLLFLLLSPKARSTATAAWRARLATATTANANMDTDQRANTESATRINFPNGVELCLRSSHAFPYYSFPISFFLNPHQIPFPNSTFIPFPLTFFWSEFVSITLSYTIYTPSEPTTLPCKSHNEIIYHCKSNIPFDKNFPIVIWPCGNLWLPIISTPIVTLWYCLSLLCAFNWMRMRVAGSIPCASTEEIPNRQL